VVSAAKRACDRAGDNLRVLGQRAQHNACVRDAVETAIASTMRNGRFAQLKR
jgi:hypothetical protein